MVRVSADEYDRTLRELALARREVAIFRVHRAETLRRIKITTKELARRKSDLDRELERRIEGHLAPQCLETCNLMQQMLPRELRNMVCEHLFGGSTLPADIFNATAWNPALKPDISRSWHRWMESLGLLHICDQKFVGKDTLREIAEAYYRFSTFSFEDQLSISEILFKRKDRWGLDLNVAKLVRSVRLNFSSVEIFKIPKCLEDQSEALLALGYPLQIIICVYSPRDLGLARRTIASGLRSIFPELNKPHTANETALGKIGGVLSIIVSFEKKAPWLKLRNH